MAEVGTKTTKRNPWWKYKRWWIPGWTQKRWWISGALILLVLVVVDLVVAFRLTSDKDLRGSILGLLTPLVALIIGSAALLNFLETRKQNDRSFETTQRAQVTDRFTKAIAQLGDQKLDIRLGAIYGLEQVAKDSDDLHWPIMQVLTAYLREHSAELQQTVEEQRSRPFQPMADRLMVGVERAPADFLAVADVIRRRRWEYDAVARVGLEEGKLEQVDRAIQEGGATGTILSRPPLDEEGHSWRESLNFDGCNLRTANFREARLKRASFAGAELERASFEGAVLLGTSFEGAQLRRASFTHARLRGDRIVLTGDHVLSILLAPTRFDDAQLLGADFSVADLQGVYFMGAQLRGATFWHARLANANFERADLKGAYLGEADFSQATGLTQEQLDSAICDEATKAPDGLTIKVNAAAGEEGKLPDASNVDQKETRMGDASAEPRESEECN